MNIKRLDKKTALDLLINEPIGKLMTMAHDYRLEVNPEEEVTFVLDSNPNYTNICETACQFCSFYTTKNSADAYTLTENDLLKKVASAAENGITTILLQGGHNPDLKLEYYSKIIETLNHEFPELHLHFFSPTEIDYIANIESISTKEVLTHFKSLGLKTLPGGGAEILVDRIRQKISPNKTSAEDWLRISREAHLLGYKTSATMTYGHIEKPEDIIEHLLKLRSLQDETQGFTAFIPWSMKPGNSPIKLKLHKPPTPAYYLRIIAISRLVLDNFPHIQASWFSEGAETGQLALNGGADDFGGIIFEENVLNSAEHQLATSAGNMIKMIEDAGFSATQRTTMYETLEHYTFETNKDNKPQVFART